MKVASISKGTPITMELFESHSRAINELSDEVFTKHGAGVTLNRPGDNGNVSKRSVEGQYFGTRVKYTPGTVPANQEVPWSVTYPRFLGQPVVTASLIIPNTADMAMKSANIIINAVDATTVSGTVVFSSATNTGTFELSVIAIGFSAS